MPDPINIQVDLYDVLIKEYTKWRESMQSRSKRELSAVALAEYVIKHPHPTLLPHEIAQIDAIKIWLGYKPSGDAELDKTLVPTGDKYLSQLLEIVERLTS